MDTEIVATDSMQMYTAVLFKIICPQKPVNSAPPPPLSEYLDLRYGLVSLREACCSVLLHGMDVDTVTGCALLASAHKHDALMDVREAAWDDAKYVGREPINGLSHHTAH